jgi:hydroxymethylglutaryl-CoA lyase
MRDIILREVGMRDGLQSINTIMPTKTKLDWRRCEAAVEIPEIEVA